MRATATTCCFLTFNPTRKARQIRFNPRVQASLWPAGETGIRGLRVDGFCDRIRQPQEIARARQKMLAATDAFRDCMDDEFLKRNDVVGYYRIRPVRITLIDFNAEAQFENLEFPHNRRGVLREAADAVGRRLLLWLQAFTIGIHFSTGLLLVLAYSLRDPV